jgi:hypothetical protein
MTMDIKTKPAIKIPMWLLIVLGVFIFLFGGLIAYTLGLLAQ